LTTVKIAGESLLRLLNDILLIFSKIEARKIELEMEDFRSRIAWKKPYKRWLRQRGKGVDWRGIG